jgi:predicted nucleic acid-binding protein
VAAVTKEAKTRPAALWLGDRNAAELLISDWVVTEVSSALSLKQRTGQLSELGRSASLASFRQLVQLSMTILPVRRAHFQKASSYADQFQLGLRGADALHLAVAADHGATVCTLDRRMDAAGAALGVKTMML